MAAFGTLASLLTQCHHNISYAKIDLASILHKPSKQRVWDYKSADVGNIRKSLFTINRERNIFHKNPNNQVEFLTESILNTFSNFSPHKMLKTILIQVISSCWMEKSNNQVNWSWIRKKDTFVNREKSF